MSLVRTKGSGLPDTVFGHEPLLYEHSFDLRSSDMHSHYTRHIFTTQLLWPFTNVKSIENFGEKMISA